MILYEILVPCQTNQGKPIRTRQHREWDRRVRRITGGLTVMAPSKGQWVSPSGELFAERMIPVRIAADVQTIRQIADMTAQFYAQEAVMYYKISDEVTVLYYPENKPENKPEIVCDQVNCECHERDGSFTCSYCKQFGYYGHMETSPDAK
jgi:hypothetical protein